MFYWLNTWITTWIVLTANITGGMEVDVCGWETFEASCDAGEMLLVEEATYGRMSKGRCVKQEYGHMGCGGDMIQHMHTLCSGRLSCSFPVSVLQGQHSVHGCPPDLTGYLHAVYSCVPVVSCDPPRCDESDMLRVPTSSGYLASHVTWTTSCGSSTCPWLVEAEEGQQINLTLYDFSEPKAESIGKICWKIASIREDGAVSKDVTICSGDSKPFNGTKVYVTDGNRVSIALHKPEEHHDLMYYAIKYEVVGCPHLAPPAGSQVDMIGDIATFSCTNAQRTWDLTCQGTAWVGKMASCHDAVGDYVDRNDKNIGRAGMLLIVGLGVVIGIVVGGSLLAMALCCIKRRQVYHDRLHAETCLLDEADIYTDNARYIQEQKTAIPMTAKPYKVIIPPRHGDVECKCSHTHECHGTTPGHGSCDPGGHRTCERVSCDNPGCNAQCELNPHLSPRCHARSQPTGTMTRCGTSTGTGHARCDVSTGCGTIKRCDTLKRCDAGSKCDTLRKCDTGVKCDSLKKCDTLKRCSSMKKGDTVKRCDVRFAPTSQKCQIMDSHGNFVPAESKSSKECTPSGGGTENRDHIYETPRFTATLPRRGKSEDGICQNKHRSS